MTQGFITVFSRTVLWYCVYCKHCNTATVDRKLPPMLQIGAMSIRCFSTLQRRQPSHLPSKNDICWGNNNIKSAWDWMQYHEAPWGNPWSTYALQCPCRFDHREMPTSFPCHIETKESWSRWHESRQLLPVKDYTNNHLCCAYVVSSDIKMWQRTPGQVLTPLSPQYTTACGWQWNQTRYDRLRWNRSCYNAGCIIIKLQFICLNYLLSQNEKTTWYSLIIHASQ